MFRRLALTAAVVLAPLASAHAQSAAQAPTSNQAASCATLHSFLLQHAGALGLDSAQLDSIHATIRTAVANGASPDSVHHVILATLMHGMSGHAAMTGDMHAAMLQHMQQMQLDSAQMSAIHACLSSAMPPVKNR
jgi:hypothetical protein